MNEQATVDRITGLLSELASESEEPEARSASTSLRIPPKMREAIKLAVDAGWIGSASEAFTEGGLLVLETVVRRAALEAHYAKHPKLRPSLVQVARAIAMLDQNPVADRPELLELAAVGITETRPNADADDIAVYAYALLSAESIPMPTRPRSQPRRRTA